KSISAFRQRSLSRRLTDSEAASRCQTRRYCIVLPTSFVLPSLFRDYFPGEFPALLLQTLRLPVDKTPFLP
ncbi:hypothetical protein, partial [Serratia sp. CY43514]|uniref:hypothetical protein n=1 Tax=Serratia sp. CY43514 TaxID=3383620 RepID=UPI004028C6DD